MHDGVYMLPAEFVALVAFLFAPPLLLAFIAQTVLFTSRGLFARGRVLHAIMAYAATVFGSLLLGAAIYHLLPRAFVSALRVRDVALGGQSFPVTPLAFVAVALAAAVATRWALRDAHARA
jgi:1,6-anhydro-N-acetylmuramate kinase